jgi:molecular chaperone HtpG
MTTEAAQTYEFQSNTSRLLHILTHSVYPKKEIFVRELISNSSDALHKLRFLSLTDTSVLSRDPNLFIRITPNKETRELTILDSGIGMDREHMQQYLGTIASSSTKQYLDNSTDKSQNDTLIGMYGIGLYSIYLVCSHADIYSRHYESDVCYKWSSDGSNKYTIEEVPNDTLTRGTRIVLHIREDMLEYLEESRLKEIIKEHSSFVDFPIELCVTKTKSTTQTEQDGDEDEK